ISGAKQVWPHLYRLDLSLGADLFLLFRGLGFLLRENDLASLHADLNSAARSEAALENFGWKRVIYFPLDSSPQSARALLQFVASVEYVLIVCSRNLWSQFPHAHSRLQLAVVDLEDAGHAFLRQALENDNLVYPVDEFRAEQPLQSDYRGIL